MKHITTAIAILMMSSSCAINTTSTYEVTNIDGTAEGVCDYHLVGPISKACTYNRYSW